MSNDEQYVRCRDALLELIAEKGGGTLGANRLEVDPNSNRYCVPIILILDRSDSFRDLLPGVCGFIRETLIPGILDDAMFHGLNIYLTVIVFDMKPEFLINGVLLKRDADLSPLEELKPSATDGVTDLGRAIADAVRIGTEQYMQLSGLNRKKPVYLLFTDMEVCSGADKNHNITDPAMQEIYETTFKKAAALAHEMHEEKKHIFATFAPISNGIGFHRRRENVKTLCSEGFAVLADADVDLQDAETKRSILQTLKEIVQKVILIASTTNNPQRELIAALDNVARSNQLKLYRRDLPDE